MSYPTLILLFSCFCCSENPHVTEQSSLLLKCAICFIYFYYIFVCLLVLLAILISPPLARFALVFLFGWSVSRFYTFAVHVASYFLILK
ncbi:hypothetical protein BX661DRAFT_191691 [Kickxella alabastrina]|uniref:uncharacterized protein n=1 Tax=Kickxella alabastrina TaxID=61397 RepID=UPI00221F4E17|nr:uncharacterized protein BX661DRAFT_191691 [Kickxella alabastrina]KAI7818432.1 hypothetical protein BX661DRAFT_191691 [Kickxella alabastrina]KAJ1945189.1 hypothetical protein GGF37_001819 [Kickxella alabastrina]